MRFARHRLSPIVAVIEFILPGNKSSKRTIKAFLDKAVELLGGGISLVVIDLFPPTPRDPSGIYPVNWDELSSEPCEPGPADRPLTIASDEAGGGLTAYVDPVAVGELLPESPLFLAPGRFVEIPLEPTYMASWALTPKAIRDLVAPPSPAS
jgi:hypothetical protein